MEEIFLQTNNICKVIWLFLIYGVLIFYTTIRINLDMETHAQASKWLWEKQPMDREHEKLKKRQGIKLYYFLFLGSMSCSYANG